MGVNSILPLVLINKLCKCMKKIELKRLTIDEIAEIMSIIKKANRKEC